MGQRTSGARAARGPLRQGRDIPLLPPAAAVGEGEGAGEESNGPHPPSSNNNDNAPPPPSPLLPRWVLLTTKNKIVLDVLGRYPPLRELVLEVARQNGSSAGNHRRDAGAILAGGNNRGNNNRAEKEIARLFADNVLSLMGCAILSGLGKCDVRQAHHPMLMAAAQSDMDVVFKGTVSCMPGTTRGVSCTALRLNWRRKADEGGGNGVEDDGGGGGEQRGGGAGAAGTWLFDCSQSTQLSVQRTPSIRPGRISPIFVMHCHGNHSFGLPGLLCLMGTDRTRNDPPVKLYWQKDSFQIKF